MPISVWPAGEFSPVGAKRNARLRNSSADALQSGDTEFVEYTVRGVGRAHQMVEQGVRQPS